jgi:hypothetical protein
MEARERPEWKDPSYRDHWYLLMVRDGMLECHCQSAGGRSKTVEIILPCIEVKEFWKNSMEDIQEDSWVSRKPWTKTVVQETM